MFKFKVYAADGSVVEQIDLNSVTGINIEIFCLARRRIDTCYVNMS